MKKLVMICLAVSVSALVKGLFHIFKKKEALANRLEEEKRELKAAMYDLKKKKGSTPQVKEDSGLPEPEK